MGLCYCSCCSVSHIWLFVTPWTETRQASPVLHHLPELAQTQVHCISDAIQPSCPLLLLLSVFPSIRVFSNESALCIRCPKYQSFSFSISPSNGYSGLLLFRIDWFDLFVVQRMHKSLSNTTVQKHQLYGSQPSLSSRSHIHTWLLEKA